ncbi:peroxidase 66-like [Tripterygium wilfordii]|uniref:peroxidase 66-like n=1 Tax=Tripterygium wilfordii TaxID=458696 RepID=UPI0018F85B6A|nr:peroxidase 66-like [Tripterygium wilfordii]
MKVSHYMSFIVLILSLLELSISLGSRSTEISNVSLLICSEMASLSFRESYNHYKYRQIAFLSSRVLTVSASRWSPLQQAGDGVESLPIANPTHPAALAVTALHGTAASLTLANLSPLDLVTPNSFDNNYFKNLIQKKGLLHSDQVLFSGGSTDKIVYEYSKNPSLFNSDFASAMIKMGNIDVLTGSSVEIRRICSAVN